MAWMYFTPRLWGALKGYGERSAVREPQTVSAEGALRVPAHWLLK